MVVFVGRCHRSRRDIHSFYVLSFRRFRRPLVMELFSRRFPVVVVPYLLCTSYRRYSRRKGNWYLLFKLNSNIWFYIFLWWNNSKVRKGNEMLWNSVSLMFRKLNARWIFLIREKLVVLLLSNGNLNFRTIHESSVNVIVCININYVWK